MKKTKRVECWAMRRTPHVAWFFSDAPLTEAQIRETLPDTGHAVRLVELRPGEVVVTREGARRPIASRLAVQNARLTAACATMETALELIADGEGDADVLAQRALRATKARKT